MRLVKVVTVVAMCVLGFGLFAIATVNDLGVANSGRVTFTEPVRVGDTLLPSGDYQVLHTMDGNYHIMVFKQLNTGRTAEARVQCQLVPLPKKATRTETGYVLNASNERVLQSLTFKGDSAQHVF
jgi:hypothetical protein